MLRRLTNEQTVDKWPLNWHFYKKDHIIIIVLEENIITIKNLESYPFRPPQVTYNGEDIKSYYAKLFNSNTSKSYNDDLIKLSGISCWCCETILCKNKWRCQSRIKDIVDEFNSFHICKKRADERSWGRFISRNLLVEDIPIYEFL